MAYKNLKPGGWVELRDRDTMVDSEDGSVTPEMSIWKWHKTGLDRIGKVATLMRPGPELEGWIRGAGFQNVTVEKLPIPLGTWPKDKHLKLAGALNRLQLEEGLESISIGTYSRTMGEDPPWSMDEIPGHDSPCESRPARQKSPWLTHLLCRVWPEVIR